MWHVTRKIDPADVERILRDLPEWFGIETAIRGYVAEATTMPAYAVRHGGRVVGLALVDRRFPESAELHLIAVERGSHGQGVGSALLAAVEDDLRADGARLLQVRTVGASFEHDGYARTRAFYAAQGFLPLDEVRDLDWNGPTLIQVKVL